MTEDMRTTTVDGRVTRFLDAGDPAAARVLLLLHAFPVGVRMWGPQLEAFPGWRVIAPALPGFDGSDPASEATVDAYASRVIRLLDVLGVDHVACAGVSMGGYVAFSMLRAAAPRLAALVLADTRGGADAPAAREGRRRMLERVDTAGPAGIAEDLLPRLLGSTTLARRPDVAAAVVRMIESQAPAGVSAAIQALMTRPDATALLGGIAVPTLTIVGEEDTLTPVEEVERMCRSIPGGKLVRLPGAGHLTSLEAPDAFNAAVREFLLRAGTWIT